MLPHSSIAFDTEAPPKPSGWRLWVSIYGFSRKRVASQLTWFVIWVAVTALSAFLHPNASGHGTHTQLGLPPCPSVLFWSRPCPACGLTTSFAATVRGDLPLAIEAHPFGPPLYAIFTLSAFVALLGWLRVKQVEITRLGNWAIAGFVIAYLAYGAVRFYVGPPLRDGGIHALQGQYGSPTP